MKKIFSLILLTLVSVSLSANVTLDDARNKARAFFANGQKGQKLAAVKPQLAYTADDNAFYVFNNGQKFVIVAGDENSEEILGYSENGAFNYDKMPDNFKFYLGELQQSVKVSKKLGLKKAGKKKTVGTKDIEPLTGAEWDQSFPYYNKIPGSGITGCVATALAQIMYKWKYPTTGSGSNSYTYSGTEYSANFGETTYDWANMLPTYNYNATDAQKDAVATLMYHVGVACNMKYTSYSSQASSREAYYGMSKYFLYDDGMSNEYRTKYSDDAWKDMIYQELAAGRPVFYTGADGGNGHAFVCEGYRLSDDKFYFNWGWSGSGNGYFVLNTTVYGYSSHEALTGIQPMQNPTAVRMRMMGNTSQLLNPTTSAAITQIAEGDRIRLKGGDYRIRGCVTTTVDVGLRIQKVGGGAFLDVPGYTNLSLNMSENYSDITTPTGITGLKFSGLVEVRPIWRRSGETEWQLMETGPDWPAPQATIVGVTPTETTTLSDTQGYTSDMSGDYAEVTYTRNYSHTNWQAIQLPFAMSYDDWKDDFTVARINTVHSDDSNATLEVILLKSGTLSANTPYLIKPKSTGDQSLTATNVSLGLAQNGVIDCSSMDYIFVITGNYSNVTNMKTNGYYALSNGAIQQATNDDTVLKPYRWYMQVTPRDNGYEAPRMLSITEVGEETVTGINYYPVETRRAKTTTYDLSGRETNANNNGIYIINGKKVLK